MAKNESKRINPATLKADEEAYIALLAITGYDPANPAYAQATLTQLYSDLQANHQAEVNAQNTLEAARDEATAAEWELHNAMLGVKAQVIAQFGDDSNEVQSLGLTKKSERKSPARKTTASA